MRHAKIISCGAYVPDQVIPNSYFDKSLGINVSDWLEEVVQIYERRWIADDQSTSDLAVAAARQCLERGDVLPEDVDLLIVATDTPDYLSPSTATVVQDKLKAFNAGTFDINSACAGFVIALNTAQMYIASGQYDRVLVIGTYAMSRFLNKKDKKTVTLFADGAGAVLLQPTDDAREGYQASELRSLGQYNSWMGIYAGGATKPMTADADESDYRVKFVHKFPPEINPDNWESMIRNLHKKIEVESQDVSRYFMTQININSIFETMDRLGEPRSKAETIMHHYGYTGSACIPMALNQAWENGSIKKGDLVYFVGSGGGLAFASSAFYL